LEFELASQGKVVPYLSFYQITKFGKFWSTKGGFDNLQIRFSFEKQEIRFNGPGPSTVQSKTASFSHHLSNANRSPPVSDSEQGKPDARLAPPV
jgi:hypothetical protein